MPSIVCESQLIENCLAWLLFQSGNCTAWETTFQSDWFSVRKAESWQPICHFLRNILSHLIYAFTIPSRQESCKHNQIQFILSFFHHSCWFCLQKVKGDRHNIYSMLRRFITEAARHRLPVDLSRCESINGI